MSNANHENSCKKLLDLKHRIDDLCDHGVLRDMEFDKKLKIDLLNLSMDISAYLLFNQNNIPLCKGETP